MANEEKYRVEAPEEDQEPEEKKGLLRPLPMREEKVRLDKDGRPQPVVKLLGVSMFEKRKDQLIMILIPALVGLIDTSLFSFIFTAQIETTALTLFLIPMIIAIPIGLTASEAGTALVSGFFGGLFFILFHIIFLISPGLSLPELGIGNFLISAFGITTAYSILVIVATILGSIIGVILREFL